MLFVRLTWSDTDLLLFFFISFHFLFFTCSHCRTQLGTDLSLFFSFSFFTSFSSHWALFIRLLPLLSFHQFLLSPSPRCTCYTIIAPCYTCYIPVTPSYTHVTLWTWELTFGLGKQYSNVFDCLTKREIRGSLPQWKVKHLVWGIFSGERSKLWSIGISTSGQIYESLLCASAAQDNTDNQHSPDEEKHTLCITSPSRFMKWDNPLVLE